MKSAIIACIASSLFLCVVYQPVLVRAEDSPPGVNCKQMDIKSCIKVIEKSCRTTVVNLIDTDNIILDFTTTSTDPSEILQQLFTAANVANFILEHNKKDNVYNISLLGQPLPAGTKGKTGDKKQANSPEDGSSPQPKLLLPPPGAFEKAREQYQKDLAKAMDAPIAVPGIANSAGKTMRQVQNELKALEVSSLPPDMPVMNNVSQENAMTVRELKAKIAAWENEHRELPKEVVLPDNTTVSAEKIRAAAQYKSPPPPSGQPPAGKP